MQQHGNGGFCAARPFEPFPAIQTEDRHRWPSSLSRIARPPRRRDGEVAAEVAKIMSGQRHKAQVKRLIDLLRQAHRGRGPYEPVRAAGCDGIMVPICGAGNQEASVATVAVYDRKGRRLGTVYLGWMPEALQETLSRQRTELLTAVLMGWKGPRPQLAYIPDGGQVPEGYYHKVLKKMQGPCQPGVRLRWVRVLDYYHAAKYISDLAETLFTEGWRRQRWARRMGAIVCRAACLVAGGRNRLQPNQHERQSARPCEVRGCGERLQRSP